MIKTRLYSCYIILCIVLFNCSKVEVRIKDESKIAKTILCTEIDLEALETIDFDNEIPCVSNSSINPEENKCYSIQEANKQFFSADLLQKKNDELGDTSFSNTFMDEYLGISIKYPSSWNSRLLTRDQVVFYDTNTEKQFTQSIQIYRYPYSGNFKEILIDGLNEASQGFDEIKITCIQNYQYDDVEYYYLGFRMINLNNTNIYMSQNYRISDEYMYLISFNYLEENFYLYTKYYPTISFSSL